MTPIGQLVQADNNERKWRDFIPHPAEQVMHVRLPIKGNLKMKKFPVRG
jgi:hypothetical protein